MNRYMQFFYICCVMKKGNHLIKDVTYFKGLRLTENKCNIPSNNVYFIYTIAQVDEKN